MRIVVATTSYPQTPGDASGHFVRAHARHLARDVGADVVVVTPGSPTGVHEETVGAGRIRVVWTGGATLFGWPGAAARVRERPIRLVAAPGALLRSAAAVRAHGPFDRAIAHWMVPSAFPVLEATSAPLEIVAHGGDVRLITRLPGWARAALMTRLLDRARRVRFVAATLRDALAGALPPALAARLLAASDVEPSPIDVPDRASLADAHGRVGGLPAGPYVAWMGRLVAGKRPLLAVDAARAAALPVVVVGDGPELARLQAAARRPGSPVAVTGLLARDRALAVLAGACALLHTSEAEGAPTVVREARALGVPVIACASGDLGAWAAVDPGITLADPSPAALGAALRRIADRRAEAA